MDLRPFIEHTLLRPDASEADIRRIVDEAIQYRLLRICIAPSWVPLAKSHLIQRNCGEELKIVAVVGFPHGDSTTKAKVTDAVESIEAGAEEVDMVMHIGRFKSKDRIGVVNDIAHVVKASKSSGAKLVKVIIETGLLTAQEIPEACDLIENAGADFVKTSTGFGPRGASIDDVRRIKEAVGNRLGIKAAGGIRDPDVACAMILAGATRIGTSSSIKLISGADDGSTQSAA
jgi:deoxyribose-phosphate aldolase